MKDFKNHISDDPMEITLSPHIWDPSASILSSNPIIATSTIRSNWKGDVRFPVLAGSWGAIAAPLHPRVRLSPHPPHLPISPSPFRRFPVSPYPVFPSPHLLISPSSFPRSFSESPRPPVSASPRLRISVSPCLPISVSLEDQRTFPRAREAKIPPKQRAAKTKKAVRALCKKDE